MFFTVDRMTPCSREFGPLPCMTVEVGAVKPAAHRKRMSVEKNLIFIHLAVGFFSNMSSFVLEPSQASHPSSGEDEAGGFPRVRATQ